MLLKFFVVFALFTTCLEASVTFFFTANRQGEIEPCGCQVNQFGGINRMAEYLSKERKRGPSLFIDSGDTFFSAPQLNPLQDRRETLRAEVIAQSYRKMGLNVFSPGERDFAKGISVLNGLIEKSGAMAVSANLQDAQGQYLFDRYRILEAGEKKIGVTGIFDPGLAVVIGVKALPWEEALTETITAMKEKGAEIIIVLSHLGLETDREVAKKFSGIFIFGSHSMDPLATPENINGSMIFQPMHEGQQIGRFDWKPDSPSAHRLFDLDKDLDAVNPVQKLMVAHRNQVRRLALGEQGTSNKGKNNFVAHPSACKGCHMEQHKFWEATNHASAYLVLYAKKQHLDAECIACHSVGFRDDQGFSLPKNALLLKEPVGGFIDRFLETVFREDSGKGALDSREDPKRYKNLKQVYHRELNKLEEAGKVRKIYADVQCENCHGNREGHPAVPRPKKKVAEKTCTACHTPARSPNFKKEWIEKVACPLMKGKS